MHRTLWHVGCMLLSVGCLYTPGVKEVLNQTPQILVPDTDGNQPVPFGLFSEVNVITVVAQDPDGDSLAAFWLVPGNVSTVARSAQQDIGTGFFLDVPRDETLDGLVISVTIADDRDIPEIETVEFLLEVP